MSISWLDTEPNWLISALIGAIVGWLIPYFFQIITSSFHRLKKFHLEGKWYGYHTTYVSGNPTIYETKWSIQKGWLKQFRVEAIPIHKRMRYEGEIEFERGQLVSRLSSTDTWDVSVMFRFNYPLPSDDHLLTGLWLSFDHDIKIASGVMILSRDLLQSDEIIQILKSKVRTESKLPLMRLQD